jgi:hypothetical protein
MTQHRQAAHARMLGNGLFTRPAERLTRWALRRSCAPVGGRAMPDEEVKFLSTYRFGGGECRVMADRVDCRVDRLPGLEYLDLMRCAGSLLPDRGRRGTGLSPTGDRLCISGVDLKPTK